MFNWENLYSMPWSERWENTQSMKLKCIYFINYCCYKKIFYEIEQIDWKSGNVNISMMKVKYATTENSGDAIFFNKVEDITQTT